MFTRSTGALLGVSVLLTVAALAVWGGTGCHAYTKYQVTEMVPVEVADEDPFAGTGFYEGAEIMEVRSRDEFHLGIFPVPQGLWDKHALSVLTVAAPPWAILGLVAWRVRRSRRS
jgi:hypothetical protein